MHKIFRDALINASGESKFVIAVVIDIRGFSAFSQMRESSDTAMYIKRVYMKLIDEYFPFASYYKSTGDGLLLTVPFNEKNLQGVARKVIKSCINCHSDFANITEEDPMVNYEVPTKIGIGVARGTACRLFSGNKTIDYSGRLLNLTSRLNDLARPSGIVIAGDFGIDLLTYKQQAIFQETDVYIKGIHEDASIKIHYIPELSTIPSYNKEPMLDHKKRITPYTKSYAELMSFGNILFVIKLDSYPRSANDIEVSYAHPMIRNGKVVREMMDVYPFNDFQYDELKVNLPMIKLDNHVLCEQLKEHGVKANMEVVIMISYLEK